MHKKMNTFSKVLIKKEERMIEDWFKVSASGAA